MDHGYCYNFIIWSLLFVLRCFHYKRISDYWLALVYWQVILTERVMCHSK